MSDVFNLFFIVQRVHRRSEHAVRSGVDLGGIGVSSIRGTTTYMDAPSRNWRT